MTFANRLKSESSNTWKCASAEAVTEMTEARNAGVAVRIADAAALKKVVVVRAAIGVGAVDRP